MNNKFQDTESPNKHREVFLMSYIYTCAYLLSFIYIHYFVLMLILIKHFWIFIYLFSACRNGESTFLKFN
jgi:hypothetical protein